MKTLYFSWRTEAHSSLLSFELGHPQWLLYGGQGRTDTKFEGLEEESTGEYG